MFTKAIIAINIVYLSISTIGKRISSVRMKMMTAAAAGMIPRSLDQFLEVFSSSFSSSSSLFFLVRVRIMLRAMRTEAMAAIRLIRDQEPKLASGASSSISSTTRSSVL